MEYRRLGRSGLKISSLVLGTLNFGNPTSKEEAIQIIDRATEEFVLQEAVGQEQFIENCPRCGANVRRRYFLGETVVSAPTATR